MDYLPDHNECHDHPWDRRVEDQLWLVPIQTGASERCRKKLDVKAEVHYAVQDSKKMGNALGKFNMVHKRDSRRNLMHSLDCIDEVGRQAATEPVQQPQQRHCADDDTDAQSDQKPSRRS
eukprot:359192-Prymnesium_polylepis.2